MGEAHFLLKYAGALRIAHHIPGRIRLKLELGGEAGGGFGEVVAEAKRFGAALGGLPSIRSVALNPLARSCTVEYDANRIPPAAWQDVLTGVTSPAAQILITILSDAAER